MMERKKVSVFNCQQSPTWTWCFKVALLKCKPSWPVSMPFVTIRALFQMRNRERRKTYRKSKFHKLFFWGKRGKVLYTQSISFNSYRFIILPFQFNIGPYGLRINWKIQLLFNTLKAIALYSSISSLVIIRRDSDSLLTSTGSWGFQSNLVLLLGQ